MRVLLVEDDVSLATVLRRGLQAEGLTVEVADNGADGLWAACESAFDVVVLDIMLPRLNGYQVVEALRARRVWTPVLMLTAKDGPYDQVDAFDLGADDYLTKPFDVVVLLARLRALVRRGAPQRPPVLSVGDLSLDLAAHRVTRGDVPITGVLAEIADRPAQLLNVAEDPNRPEVPEDPHAGLGGRCCQEVRLECGSSPACRARTGHRPSGSWPR